MEPWEDWLAEYDGRKVDDDLEIVTIPANTYAVFTSKGKMPDSLGEVAGAKMA